MELYRRSKVRKGLHQNRSREWAPASQATGLEESMGRLRLWGREAYPARSGMVECAYYMRTGICGYGANCRYNHPPDRASVGGSASLRDAAEYPERVGEPDCQYYLLTGTCKFGASCKFHHPRNAGGSLINVPLNVYGYPLRLGEKECSYYLQTGRCKYGNVCKFHHPQPAGLSMPATACPFYSTLQSPSALSEQYGCASTSYSLSRPSVLTSSYVPGTYGPYLLHTGVVSVPNWGSYTGPITPTFTPGAQASSGATSAYGVSLLNSSATAFAGTYLPLTSSSSPSDSNLKKQQFPERPGQPECQYYLRYGDCKFGPSCRYHHPPNLVVAKAYSALSPLGLPLRPGIQSCTFYLKKGHCKFGHSCKFDHPMGTFEYSPYASSLTDVPVTPYMLSSSTAMFPTVSFSEGQPEFVGSKLDPQVTGDWPNGSSLSSSVGLTFSRTAPFWHSSFQLSGQGSRLNVGGSTRIDGEVRGHAEQQTVI